MRTWSLALCVLLACGPSVADSDGPDTDTDPTPGDELPASCDAPPYDDACQEAFAERCEAQPDQPACDAVTSLPGGLALQCTWVEPERIVDAETCETEPAEPRCVGVAYLATSAAARTSRKTGTFWWPSRTLAFRSAGASAGMQTLRTRATA